MIRLTPGYVGADISTLCKEASILAVERIITTDEDVGKDPDSLENVSIQINDFKLAAKRVQPSAQREGFTTVPNTTWSDIGALANVRQEL